MIFRSRNDVRCAPDGTTASISFRSTNWLTVFVLGRLWTFNIIYHSIGCSFDFCSMRYSTWWQKFCEKRYFLSHSHFHPLAFCLCAERKLRHRIFVFGAFFSVSFSFDSIWWLRPFSISTVPQKVLFYTCIVRRTRTSYFSCVFLSKSFAW